jgi:tetratricopeptide (TPR) repeat protein
VVQQQLGQPRVAAETFARLARLRPDQRQRAEALYHEGEVLRLAVGDPSGALDAYLRASDVDPSFAPPLVRIVTHWWDVGDYKALAEVGAELLRAGDTLALVEEDAATLVAFGAVLGPGDVTLARAALDPTFVRPAGVARRLHELAQRLVGRAGGPATPPMPALPKDALDHVLRILIEVVSPAQIAEIIAELRARIVADPSRPSAALAAARLADLSGDRLTAIAGYGLLVFLDLESPYEKRLRELGEAPAPRPEALRAGAVDHPDCRGPLREILRGVAAAIAGAPGLAPALPSSPPVAADAPSVIVTEAIRAALDAPAVWMVSRADDWDVVLEGARPLHLAVGARAERLPRAELAFLVARALEDARSGTFAVASLTPSHLRSLLQGIAVATGRLPRAEAEARGMGAPGHEVADWIATDDSAALLPAGDARGPWLAALDAALDEPPDLDRYLAGCDATGDRLGLLLCRSPLVALNVVVASLRGSTGGSGRTDPMLAVAGLVRQEQVRTMPMLGELVKYIFSDDYRRATGSA